MSGSHALRGRVGGFVTASRVDGRENTAAARATFRESFVLLVDPEGVLPPGERARRAEAARRAHYARLALKSAQARAGRRDRRAAPPDGGQPGTSGGGRR